MFKQFNLYLGYTLHLVHHDPFYGDDFVCSRTQNKLKRKNQV